MAHACKNGEDFEPLYCDACGDCIYCFGEDACMKSPDGKHAVVVDEYVPEHAPVREVARVTHG